MPSSSSAAFSPRTRAALRRRLIAWYRRHARAMPWRGLRDPYPIWVSEVMLQQTQVVTATPYYHRFLERFPTLPALARARIDDVLAAWAGLGYYRRARHLHEAARIVVREHAGSVPSDPDVFGALPGIGRYTRAAVLSIAFDRPLAVLDGNVARVLSRLVARPWSVRDPRGAAALQALAQSLIPMRQPGDWNQAMMELGATICTPRAPRCSDCPVAAQCRAHALGKEESFPPVARRAATIREVRAVAWIERRGGVLLERRSGAQLEGLWEPPSVALEPGADAQLLLAKYLRSLGVHARLTASEVRVEHIITHRVIGAQLWRGTLTKPLTRGTALRWTSIEKPERAVTALMRKAGRGLRAG